MQRKNSGRSPGAIDRRIIAVDMIHDDTVYQRLCSIAGCFSARGRNDNHCCCVAIKIECRKIESGFSDHVEDYMFRTVNIDPGILTPANLVMVSHREYNHRVYLKEGVYAETVLIYARDRYVRLPWTDADFCHDEAIDFFVRVRNSFEDVAEKEPAEIISHLKNEGAGWVNNADPDDDVTFVVIKVK